MILSKKVILIAEACDNHFGKIENAFKMVDAASKARADVIKFQHHLPDEEMLSDVPKSKNFKISLYKFLKKYSLKIEDHYKIFQYCKKKKIQYLCTPFSWKAAIELNKIKVPFFKVGSGEFTDTPFIERLLKFNKPVIFSTGMSSQKEIDMMYNFINRRKKNHVAFMHCTSEYPPDFKDLNLGYIPKLIKKYNNFIIGHSDHTNTTSTSLAAVTLGARIIEKHVYLDKLNYGPDRDVSISFKQLKELKNDIEILEKSLGNQKKIYSKEKKIRSWARRSVVSIKDIQKGQKLNYENLWSKRPGTGIPSYLLKMIIGKKANKNISKDSILKKSDFK